MKEQQVLLGTFQRLLKGGLKNSSCFTSITAPYVDSITTQSMFVVAGENSTETELKRQHQALKPA